MALYLLVRDHWSRAGMVEVGWRVALCGGQAREGDFIFSYHANLEDMLVWARSPARAWHKKMPIAVIDVRDLIAPESKLFASVPALGRLPYYSFSSSADECAGGTDPDLPELPGDEDTGMWMARAKPVVTRRQVYRAALGAAAGQGSVRDRLQRKFVEDLNRMDSWARGVKPAGDGDAGQRKEL